MSSWQYTIFIVYKIKCCVLDWRVEFFTRDDTSAQFFLLYIYIIKKLLCWHIISCICRSTPWCIHTNLKFEFLRYNTSGWKTFKKMGVLLRCGCVRNCGVWRPRCRAVWHVTEYAVVVEWWLAGKRRVPGAVRVPSCPPLLSHEMSEDRAGNPAVQKRYIPRLIGVTAFCISFKALSLSREERLLGSSCPSFRPCPRLYQLSSNIREVWYRGLVMAICREIPNLVKIEKKNIGPLTWRPKWTSLVV